MVEKHPKTERNSLIQSAYINSKTKKIIINILYQSTYMLVRLLFIAFLANKYDLSVLGEYALIITISIFFNFLCGLEIITGIAKNILKNKLTNNYINIIFSWAVIATILFYIGIKNLYKGDASVELISIVLFLEFLSSELIRLLTLLSKNYLVIAIQFIKQVLWIPLFILYDSLMESKQILNIVMIFWVNGLLLSLIVVFINFKEFRPKLVKLYSYKNYIIRILQKLKYYLAVALIANLTIYSDRFFINSILGAKELGSFFYYQTLASPVIGLIQASILTLLYPGFFKPSNNHFKSLNKNIINIGLISCIFSIAIYIVVEYFLPDFFIKENFKRNNILLIALIVGNILYNLSTVCHLMLLPRAQPSKFFMLTIYCFLIQQIFLITLILLFKMDGLIYYSFLVPAVIFFIKYQYAKKIYINSLN